MFRKAMVVVVAVLMVAGFAAGCGRGDAGQIGPVTSGEKAPAEELAARYAQEGAGSELEQELMAELRTGKRSPEEVQQIIKLARSKAGIE